MPTVEVRNVSKNYGIIRALDRVSLTILDGEYFVVLGPTGAGKTTLLRIIAGLVEPDEGEILIDGVNVKDIPPERRNVTYMPQGYALFPHMTVWENVSFGAEARGIDLEVAKEVLEIVGLYHRRHSLPSQLSGGQQQRVALARALASGARLTLLDEPLSALDVLLNMELRYELRRLARKLGLTVIHVTHNYEEALSIADRLLVLRRGKVEQVGTPEEVYYKPRTPFVANFLGEVNIFEGTLTSIGRSRLTVEVDGLGELEVSREVDVEGPLIVCYRPENIEFAWSRGGVNVYPFKVLKAEFQGLKSRFYLESEKGGIRVIVDRWFEKIGGRVEGRVVNLYFPPSRALVYPYPREGLVEALSVE